MMELKNILKFAFWMHEVQGLPSAAIVRTMLRHCDLDDLEFAGTPLQMSAICRKIVIETRYKGAETNAIDARFSRDSHTRFLAQIALAKHFRAELHGQTRFDLMVKLVERCYLDPEERVGAWDIKAIANQFKAGKWRVHAAFDLLKQHIDQIENIALENLKRELERKRLFNHSKEAA